MNIKCMVFYCMSSFVEVWEEKCYFFGFSFDQIDCIFLQWWFILWVYIIQEIIFNDNEVFKIK